MYQRVYDRILGSFEAGLARLEVVQQGEGRNIRWCKSQR